jgi:DNA-binding NtrC family response regulator
LNNTILVIDDEEIMREILETLLTREGHQVRLAATAAEGLDLIRSMPFDAAIVDVMLPGMDGVTALDEIKKIDDDLPVLMITAFASVENAIAAMKRGAFDYISKPFKNDEVLAVLRNALAQRRLVVENRALRQNLQAHANRFGEIIGKSPRMRQVFDLIIQAAPSRSTILIQGESGTGKELVAAAIHRLSGRAKGPFIPVNCSAIPEDLLESEFFGHVRGAFSGAVSDALGLFRGANEGTIFLDEIAELSPGLQVKLLRVLQEMQVRPVGSTKAHPVDVRVIAATNRDLDRSIADGRFRQDLYYRLNVVRVSLPPLRTRREDIPALVNHFLRRYNRRFRRDVKGITPDALAALSAYDFPGNVRELENVVERAFAMGAREQITLTDLPVLGTASVPAVATPASGSVPRLADVEKDLILRALAFYKDDKEAAASALGISRRTIYRRLKEYGML